MYGERREEGKAQAKGLCFLATRDTKIVGKADAGYASHIHWRCVSDVRENGVFSFTEFGTS